MSKLKTRTAVVNIPIEINDEFIRSIGLDPSTVSDAGFLVITQHLDAYMARILTNEIAQMASPQLHDAVQTAVHVGLIKSARSAGYKFRERELKHSV